MKKISLTFALALLLPAITFSQGSLGTGTAQLFIGSSTAGQLTVGTSGGGAILTGTGGALYIGGAAVGTGTTGSFTNIIASGSVSVAGVLQLGTTGIVSTGSTLLLAATGTDGVVSTGTAALVGKNLYLSQATLATGTLCTVDFAADGIKHFTASGDFTITGTNFPAEGASARPASVIISAGTATRAITVTVPAGGWTFFGSTGTPSSLTANRKGLFSAMATGSASAVGSFAPEN